MRIQRLIGVVAALALLALPAGVFAAPGSSSSFSATGNICVLSFPSSMEVNLTGAVLKVQGGGEVLMGAIEQSSGWAGLQGAGVTVVLAEQNLNYNYVTGSFVGKFQGTIAVVLASGDILAGNFSGTNSGLFVDPSAPYFSAGQVSWSASNGAISAQGSGSTYLTPDSAGKYCGPLTLHGAVK